MSATMKAAAVGVAALLLGLLGGQRMARSSAPGPPAARQAPMPDARPPQEALAPKAELGDMELLELDLANREADLRDARAQVELLKRKIAEQDRRQQGLEDLLAEARRGAGAVSKPLETEATVKEPAWKTALREKLGRNVFCRAEGIGGEGMSFRDELAYLESRGGIRIRVDRLAEELTEGFRWVHDIRLTSPVEGWPLEFELDTVVRLAHPGLRWVLRDEGILITTEEGAKEPSP